MFKKNQGTSGYLIKEEHLFGGKTYRCSRCKAKLTSAVDICPCCKAVMKKTKNDPAWVDEMADYDEV